MAREKQLEKQIITAEDRAKDFDKKAEIALSDGDEALAKNMLAQKVTADKRKTLLEQELEMAKATSAELKHDLAKLEDQVQVARQKKEELIRRKRAADSKLQSRSIRRKSIEAMQSIAASIASFDSSSKNLESYEKAIQQLEAEAEATQEVLNLDAKDDIDLEKFDKDQKVEDELARLKKRLKK